MISIFKMKKPLFPVLLCAIIALCAVCCEKKAAVSGQTANAIPNRIISAAPSNTEIIAGLGMADKLIAVDKYSNDIYGVPFGIAEIDFFFPDIEAVVGMRPDLIIANEINMYGVSDNPFKLLSDLGIPVLDIPASGSIEGIYSDIMTIAGVLGVQERGEEMAAAMREDIARLAGMAANSAKKTVYFEISPAPFMYSFGTGTFLNEMIEIAGGKNIFSDQTSWFAPSAEEIINRNPDIIFTMEYPGDDPVAEIMSRPEFAGITAVVNRHVYAIDADSASRATQNIVTALRLMVIAINGSL